MTQMIRFCPNCQTERTLEEIFCAGTLKDRSCDWNLAGEAIHEAGWRPAIVAPVEPTPLPSPTEDGPRCENGHQMERGDLMCSECGGSLDGARSTPTPTALDESPIETVIDGWVLLRQVASTDTVREIYLAQKIESGQQAALSLYRPGAEPDPAIYDVVRRLPLEHVPQIFGTGRWNERAYEISEELTGETLADLGVVLSDMESIHHIVSELGQALHVFNEAGLRHRDLRPGCLLVRSRDGVLPR